MPAFFAAVPIGDNLLFSLNSYPQKAKKRKNHYTERISYQEFYEILPSRLYFAQKFPNNPRAIFTPPGNWSLVSGE